MGRTLALLALLLLVAPGCPRQNAGPPRERVIELAPAPVDDLSRYSVEGLSTMKLRDPARSSEQEFQQRDRLVFELQRIERTDEHELEWLRWLEFEPAFSLDEPNPELSAQLQERAVGQENLLLRDDGDNRSVLGLSRLLPEPTDRQVTELVLQLMAPRLPTGPLSVGEVFSDSFVIEGSSEGARLRRVVNLEYRYLGSTGAGRRALAHFGIEGVSRAEVQLVGPEGFAEFRDLSEVEGTLLWHVDQGRPDRLELRFQGEGRAGYQAGPQSPPAIRETETQLALTVVREERSQARARTLNSGLQARFDLKLGEELVTRPSATPSDRERGIELLSRGLENAAAGEGSRARRILALAQVAAGRPAEALAALEPELMTARDERLIQLFDAAAALYSVERGDEERLRAHPQGALRGFLIHGMLGDEEGLSRFLHPDLTPVVQAELNLSEAMALPRQGASLLGMAGQELLGLGFEETRIDDDVAVVTVSRNEERDNRLRAWLRRDAAGHWRIFASDGFEPRAGLDGLILAHGLLVSELASEAPDESWLEHLIDASIAILDERGDFRLEGYDLVSSRRRPVPARALLLRHLMSWIRARDPDTEGTIEALSAVSEEVAEFLRVRRALAEDEQPPQELVDRLEALGEALPEVGTVQLWLVLALQDAGELPSAESHARSLLASHGESWSLLDLLGNLQHEQGRNGDAIDSFERAIEIDPRQTSTYNNLAYLMALEDTRLEDALRLVNRALEDEPENLAYLDTLAEILFRLGRVEQALEVVDRGLTVDPRDSQLLGQRVRFQQALDGDDGTL